MKDEILKYCESDVDILMRSCMAFRDIFMQETTIDPFERSLTIASACNLVFRKLFLKPETIAIIPHNGYRARDKQSALATRWLQWIAKKEKIVIQHAFNGREATIGPYKVDGLCGKNIFEFYGCFWHGCPKCIKKRTTLTADQYTTAREAYDRTLERRQFLQNEGYTIVEKWECELKREIEENHEMEEFFVPVKMIEPLNPRDGILIVNKICI